MCVGNDCGSTSLSSGITFSIQPQYIRNQIESLQKNDGRIENINEFVSHSIHK